MDGNGIVATNRKNPSQRKGLLDGLSRSLLDGLSRSLKLHLVQLLLSVEESFATSLVLLLLITVCFEGILIRGENVSSFVQWWLSGREYCVGHAKKAVGPIRGDDRL